MPLVCYDEYTLTGLMMGTDYEVFIEAVYNGVASVRSSNQSFSTDGASWTVMVWLDGDNNLNPQAISDFHEMEYGLYLAQQG